MYCLSEKHSTLNSRIVNLVQACKNRIGAEFEAEIVLYGSQARAEAMPDSDLDLLVIANDSVTSTQKREIHDAIYEIGLEYDIVISLIITSRQQWESPVTKLLPLYKSITQEGIRVA